MKQYNFFGKKFEDQLLDDKYSKKIKAPIYKPKNKCPHILELLNNEKTKQLISDINNSNVNNDEKSFLIEAAKRHSIFYYSKIADYYSHASPEMQNLMEKSALIIIDLEKAIEYGFAELSEKLEEEFLEVS